MLSGYCVSVGRAGAIWCCWMGFVCGGIGDGGRGVCRRGLAMCRRVETVESVSREVVLKTLRSARLMLCVRSEDEDMGLVVEAVRAAVRGGVRAVEVTMTTPGALKIVREVTKEMDVLVGAGTVMSIGEAELARQAGASFVMSPISDIDVIRACNEVDLLMIPGAMTPTEVHTAYNVAKAKAVKIFPANICGPVEFVKAMQGPFPHIPLFPTSGVKVETVPSLLQCKNVLAVGFSKQVLTLEALENRDWETITFRTKRWMEAAQSV